MRASRRRHLLIVALAAVLGTIGLAAPSADASSSQQSIFEADTQLRADPGATLQTLRLLGDQVVRLSVFWGQVAPNSLSHKRPKHFDASDPAAYPAANWSIIDTIVTDAQADGLTVDLDPVSPSPLWATGPGAPTEKPHPNWEPSPTEFGAFVTALGKRYSGSYVPPGAAKPLPRVAFWSVWNEANLGFELAPQGVGPKQSIENSGRMYRALLDQAWTALQRTGHGSDTILIGELAPRGYLTWGVFGSMKPLVFLRALYCLDSSYHQLRGTAAALRGCPTTAAGSRAFRSAHPALFQASAFSDHFYTRWYPPDKEPIPDPNYASLPVVGQLERALDRVQRSYGSSKRFQIYDTEFGYITSPPNRSPFTSPATSAYYLNWAEYISWRNPRIASFDQYLLTDGSTTKKNLGGWASGLLTSRGKPKVTFDAWRLPLYLPVTSTRFGHSLEVWGCVRPAQFANLDSGLPQSVQIQFQQGSHRQYTTVETVPISSGRCYFDTHVVFPSSGTVRLSWSYPPSDPMLAPGGTVSSRTVRVTIH